MTDPHVLRVFVDEKGRWGNPLGVFLDGGGIRAEERRRIAAELGYSETVFVEDRESGRIRIHTPTIELPFAGHPCVGAAWLLAQEGTPVKTLRPPAGQVPVRVEKGLTWIEARAEWSPSFEFRQLATPHEVQALKPSANSGNVYAWAWIDEPAGTIRARAFVPEAGIAEDEATGSAVLTLAAQLNLSITVLQGQGSVLVARPATDGRARVGGWTRTEE